MNFYRFAFLTLASLLVMPAAAPQTTVTPIAASAPTAVPSLVPFSGTATITEGKAGQATITFQIFKEETAGESLWTETQSVQIDPAGHYKVQLGATSPNGLPPTSSPPEKPAGSKSKSPAKPLKPESSWPASPTR